MRRLVFSLALLIIDSPMGWAAPQNTLLSSFCGWLTANFPNSDGAGPDRRTRREFRPVLEGASVSGAERLETRALLYARYVSTHLTVTVKVQDSVTDKIITDARTAMDYGGEGATGVNGFSQLNGNIYGRYGTHTNFSFYIAALGYFTAKLDFSAGNSGGTDSFAEKVKLVPLTPFLQRFYQNVFGRPISAPELSYYINDVKGVGPTLLTTNLLNFTEGIAARVTLFARNLDLTLSADEITIAERQLAHGWNETRVFSPILRNHGLPASTLRKPSYLTQTAHNFYSYLLPGFRPKADELRPAKAALLEGGQHALILQIVTSSGYEDAPYPGI